MTADNQAHVTVLLDEAVEGLAIKPDGIYVDGTFGRGGHSRLILSKLGPNGRLIGIDRDPSAIAVGEELAKQDSRFQIVHGPFSGLAGYISKLGLSGQIDGVLLDLGVSSPQLDEAERGFSFMSDGPLDMRMDPTRGQSAAEWLAVAEPEQISKVLKEYGEERFAWRIAKAIVARREDPEQEPLTRTRQLAELIDQISPFREKNKHPATRSFQAIRIFINDELGEIHQALDGALDVLADQGRLAVISFHSLEDRIAKRFIRQHEKGPELPPGLPLTDAQLRRHQPLKAVGKAIKPSKAEIQRNSRARSSVLRIARRLRESE